MRAFRGLLRAQASLSRQLDAELERQHGLPLSSFEALQLLDEQPAGKMRMCDLAAELQISRSGLTRLVDRLSRDGLLERCTCAHDARGAYACLTDAGREQVHAAHATHLAVVQANLLPHLDARELSELAELCERIGA
ncbi:MAG TPA: MarR family winged helix-turn-helix transcriptional regulator [Solirubrobacteraceae bacterium]|nr:MarR family winged helix-turn-helix transcriptional regulator [Solirubrobacteraceae bacterium]